MYYTSFQDIPPNAFSVIYADPPWAYNDKMAGHSFSLDHEYPTMSSEQLLSLPVQSIAAKDAVLFMWATSPNLPIALDVMKAWGFKFKTIAFVWSKRTVNDKEAVNLGRWTLGNVEICLLGVRGRPQRAVKNIRQLVVAKRGRHSEKPSEVRNRINTLMGEVRRIELYARGASQGWSQYGNQPEGL